MKFYAIYDGDNFIEMFDTIQECADFLGIKKVSAQWLTSPTVRKRNPKVLIYKYDLDEEEVSCEE